jgi:hypothetical protein
MKGGRIDSTWRTAGSHDNAARELVLIERWCALPPDERRKQWRTLAADVRTILSQALGKEARGR